MDRYRWTVTLGITAYAQNRDDALNLVDATLSEIFADYMLYDAVLTDDENERYVRRGALQD